MNTEEKPTATNKDNKSLLENLSIMIQSVMKNSPEEKTPDTD